MNEEQLHWATGLLLPAEVTIPGDPWTIGSTPRKPWAGPFKVDRHVCTPDYGVCVHCGENRGDAELEEVHRNVETEGFVYGPTRPTRPSRRLWDGQLPGL